jgi:acetyl-CoA acyltransferase
VVQVREAWIIDAVRTPVGKNHGALRNLRPDDTFGWLIGRLLEKTGVDAEGVEDVICGCVTQIGEQGLDVARMSVLAGGLPISIPGTTVHRHCGSSQQAVVFACNTIIAGDMDVIVAGGTEFMSRVPMGSDGYGEHLEKANLGTALSPKLFERFGMLVPQGISAEIIAERWGIARSELDEFGKRSNDLAIEATDKGIYKEIVPVEAPQDDGSTELVEKDEGPRRGVSLEKMATLKTPFKPDGVVTAGNSSQISDGAAAALIVSSDRAVELGLKPRARYVATALTGEDPIVMLTGPITATPKVLQKAGLTMKDIDVVEINEAFASVVLAWKRELDPPNWDRVNPWGGAIANGHPLGASGGKLFATLLSELDYYDGRYGLQTMCMGMGMGIASIFERIP